MTNFKYLLNLELKIINRKKNKLILPFIFCFLFLILFFSCFSINNTIEVAVYDQNNTSSSREYIQTLEASGNFEVISYASSPDEISHLLQTNQIDIAIVIPPSFASDIKTGNNAFVDIYISESFPITSLTALLQTNAITNYYYNESYSQITVHAEGFATSYAEYTTPAFFAFIISAFSLLLVIVRYVRENQNASNEILFHLGYKPTTIFLAKSLSNFAIIFVLYLFLYVIMLFFNLQPQSFIVFSLLMCLFIFCNIFIANLITSIFNKNLYAIILAIISISLLVCGIFTPVDKLPKIIDVLSLFMPLTYFVNVTREIYLPSPSYAYLIPQIIVLIIFTTASFFATIIIHVKKYF